MALIILLNFRENIYALSEGTFSCMCEQTIYASFGQLAMCHNLSGRQMLIGESKISSHPHLSVPSII